MYTFAFTVNFFLGLHIMSLTTEGTEVSSTQALTADAQGVNMTFMVHTLNQIVNQNGGCPVQTDGRNIQREVRTMIRDEMENLTVGMYQRMTEVCHQIMSNVSKINGEDGQNKAADDIGETLKTLEILQKQVRDLDAKLVQARRDNQLILETIQRLENKSDTGIGPGAFFYRRQPRGCGSLYNFDMVPRNWAQARSFCRSQGGDLVSIESAGEDAFLKRIVLKNNENPLLQRRPDWIGYWTSGSDEGHEGRWVWKATGSSLRYKNWPPGQPDNHYNVEHVLSIRAISGRWNDMDDARQMFAICEKLLN